MDQRLWRYPFAVYCYLFAEKKKIMDTVIYPVYFLEKIVKKRQKVFLIFNFFATSASAVTGCS